MKYIRFSEFYNQPKLLLTLFLLYNPIIFMSEKLKYRDYPEIVATQQWLEEFIIGKGICPPLAWYAKKNTFKDGTIDWSGFSRHLEINSYYNIKIADGRELTGKVSKDYLGFLDRARKGEAVSGAIYILPDFRSNRHYDEFMKRVKIESAERLSGTEDGTDLMEDALRQAQRIRGEDYSELILMAGGSESDRRFVASQFVEGLFNMVYFYGKRIERQQYKDFAATRGPVERQQVLSRAPYYLIQVVNALEDRSHMPAINRPRLYQKNTNMAVDTNLKQHDKRMSQIRKGEIG